MYAQTVCTSPLLGEEGPGNEARNYLHVASDQVETKCEWGGELTNRVLSLVREMSEKQVIV